MQLNPSTFSAGTEIEFLILQDGEAGSGFADEVATLLDPNGINATIRALGLGADAKLAQLDLIDDGLANGSDQRVLMPSTLTAGLTGSAVPCTAIEGIDVVVNGGALRTITAAAFEANPLGVTAPLRPLDAQCRRR